MYWWTLHDDLRTSPLQSHYRSCSTPAWKHERRTKARENQCLGEGTFSSEQFGNIGWSVFSDNFLVVLSFQNLLGFLLMACLFMKKGSIESGIVAFLISLVLIELSPSSRFLPKAGEATFLRFEELSVSTQHTFLLKHGLVLCSMVFVSNLKACSPWSCHSLK